MSFYLPSCRPLLRLVSRPIYAPTLKALHPPRCLTALHSRSFLTPTPTSDKPPPDFAFVLDIDGVLMHGPTPHPRATEALTFLRDNSIEYILLTNGGGQTEKSRAESLSSHLGVPIHISQVIQSHTPFAPFAKQPNFNTVLVIGGEGDRCREVAEGYGFRNVILPCDILAAYPALSPFSTVKTFDYARPLPEGEVKIDAIFVFNDPRDWALDIQLLIDIIVSDGGKLGTQRSGYSKGHVPLYFSNPDMLWANEYHLPRLGQGGFRMAFQGAFQAAKRHLKFVPLLSYKIIGKPFPETYKYAEEVLMEWRKAQLNAAGAEAKHPEIKTVYMVGDNPASDIAGANKFKSERGVEWISVLAKSGVYRDGDKTKSAKVIVDDVLEGVKWALKWEEWKKSNGPQLLCGTHKMHGNLGLDARSKVPVGTEFPAVRVISMQRKNPGVKESMDDVVKEGKDGVVEGGKDEAVEESKDEAVEESKNEPAEERKDGNGGVSV